MDNFRRDLPPIVMLMYLDYLNIILKRIDEHLSDLEKEFQVLRQFKLHVYREKCSFVRYFGPWIYNEGSNTKKLLQCCHDC